MEAQVRLSDRVILQFGKSLGEVTDAETGELVPVELVELTEPQIAALLVAFAAPHSRIHLSAAGEITFDPPDPLPPPTPERIAFVADKADVVDFFTDAGVDAFLAAANGTATDVQRDVIIKRTIRAVRSLARATRYAIRELATDD